jgi:hypothetical protein
VKIGGTTVPPVAKDPRKVVVRNTSELHGPSTIERSENGMTITCPFRNLGIKLSAPKLSLLRGQTTTLHVVVMGLAGINEDVPLDLVNNSPTVIAIGGGNIQHTTIRPKDVESDGTFSADHKLTGIMAGGFGITGTVRWTQTCSKPAS